MKLINSFKRKHRSSVDLVRPPDAPVVFDYPMFHPVIIYELINPVVTHITQIPVSEKNGVVTHSGVRKFGVGDCWFSFEEWEKDFDKYIESVVIRAKATEESTGGDANTDNENACKFKVGSHCVAVGSCLGIYWQDIVSPRFVEVTGLTYSKPYQGGRVRQKAFIGGGDSAYDFMSDDKYYPNILITYAQWWEKFERCSRKIREDSKSGWDKAQTVYKQATLLLKDGKEVDLHKIRGRLSD